MAISTRLRFEVLRRDGYACRYCGSPASATPLTVDHVIPRTLGGADEPSNLASACGPCNTGKSSTLVDGSTVADVDPSDLERGGQHRRSLSQATSDLMDLLFTKLELDVDDGLREEQEPPAVIERYRLDYGVHLSQTEARVMEAAERKTDEVHTLTSAVEWLLGMYPNQLLRHVEGIVLDEFEQHQFHGSEADLYLNVATKLVSRPMERSAAALSDA